MNEIFVKRQYKLRSPVDLNFGVVTETVFTIKDIKKLKLSIAEHIGKTSGVDPDKIVVNVSGSDKQLLYYYIDQVLPANFRAIDVYNSGLETKTELL